MGNLANSEDPDEMQHHAAFHQGLHCLLRLKQSSGTDIHHNIENTTCYPLKYTMGSPNVSGYRCVSDCRSRGREFDPGPVPYFRGD